MTPERRTGYPTTEHFDALKGNQRRTTERRLERLVSKEDNLSSLDFIGFVKDMALLIGGHQSPLGVYCSSDEPHGLSANPEKFGLTDSRTPAHFRFTASSSWATISIHYPQGNDVVNFSAKPPKPDTVGHITTHNVVDVPRNITVTPYSAETPLKPFPDGKYIHHGSVGLKAEQARKICKRVLEIYREQKASKRRGKAKQK